MPILGGTILNRALAVVGSDTIALMRFTGRITNDAGLDVATYAAPVPLRAQVQAIKHSMFVQLGLDFQKDYIQIYSPNYVGDLQRNKEADRFLYGNTTYEILSNEDWKRPQGFIGAIAVRIS